MKIRHAIISMVLIIQTTANAGELVCPDQNKYVGWYWKNPCVELEDGAAKKEARNELPPLPAESDLMSMHPKDIQKMYEDYTDQAIWKPSMQNIANHIIMKDVIRRKAKAFSAVSSFYVQVNPDFNAYKDYPSNAPGRSNFVETRNRDIDNYLKNKGNEYSFILLARNDKRSIDQSRIVEDLVEKLGWEYRFVDIEKYPQIATSMGIKYTPTLMLLSRKAQDFMPIVSGIETQDRIKANTYRSIRYKEGEISPEQVFTTDSEMDSTMDPLGKLNGQARNNAFQ